MQGLNRVTLVGNIGADPELRFTQAGTALLPLRIAVNERIKRNDEWTDHVEWFSCSVWGKRAEGLVKVLSKGAAVLVEGAIRRRTFEDKNGRERESWEVNADTVILLGGGGAFGRARSKPAQQPSGDEQPGADDDIAF